MSELILGIDGGGTKTVAWLGTADRSDGEPIGRGQAGAGNPRSVGFDNALANLEFAIDQAFADAGLERRQASIACIAMAGADRASERAHLETWASQRIVADRLCLTNDARPLLAMASPDDIGIALICGTGSMAYGRDQQGATGRCGGWGYLLGDEGSGYDIAIQGLRAAARAADGRGAGTSLLSGFLAKLELKTPQQLIETIYQPLFTRDRIAELSGVVFDAALESDSIADAIVKSSAIELAQLVTTLAQKLSFDGRFPLALSGGVLVNRPAFADALLQHVFPRPVSVSIVREPVRGALLMARRELERSLKTR